MIAGRAPILDFDGTLAYLDVDWDGLRRRLGVERIVDLWRSRDSDRAWADVTAAEIDAAAVADPVGPVFALVEQVEQFAVLSSNSAQAISVFLQRFPDLRRRVAIVVGREDLGGPKTDFPIFERGYLSCIRAMRPQARPVYVGDQAYELEYAVRLGAEAVNVKALTVRDG